MAKTIVADIIIPTDFEKYAIERTAELSRFGESGIIEVAPEFDTVAQGGGREVKMPFWKDLTAARQILNDSGTLAVNKITADTDIARIHNDAQTWSVNHLAQVVSGDDPIKLPTKADDRGRAGLAAVEAHHFGLPIDVLGGEVRHIGLSAAQVPAKIVERPALGVGFRGDNSLVLQRGDRPLFLEANFRPLLFGEDGPRQPAHVQSEVVNPAQENIGGH